MQITRRTALGGLSAAILVSTTGAAPALGQTIRKPTPATDLGPFYPVVRPADVDGDLSLIGWGRRARGQIIEVFGRILDRRGNPIRGARIELWQANAAGRYAHAGDGNTNPLDPNFQGYGLIRSGRAGEYRYVSIMPGAYPDGDSSPRPPHVHLDISGRRDRLVTQMIFAGDPLNDRDDVLANLDRTRLTATNRGKAASGALRYEWDVILANG